MVYVCGVGQPSSHKVFQEHLEKVYSISALIECAVEAVLVVITIVVAVSYTCRIDSLRFHHALINYFYRFLSFNIFTLLFSNRSCSCTESFGR